MLHIVKTSERIRCFLFAAKATAIGIILLLTGGCATPVGVDPVDIQSSYQINSVNALSAVQLSEASKTLLRRNDLLDRFDSEPAQVLTELHASLNPSGDEDKLFALAELSMLHAQNTQDPSYFLASAVYAWSLLFPANDEQVGIETSDPRLRLTYDLYNQGLAQGLAAREKGEQRELLVELKPGEYKLPFGSLHISLDEAGLSWGGYQLKHFVSTTGLDLRGLRNRYRSPGLGAALTASLADGPASAKVLGSERLGPRTKVAVTAILHLEHARRDLSHDRFSEQLALYAADQGRTVDIDNMNPNNPGLNILASIPVSAEIPAHSIITVEGDGPKEEGDDGVVAYQSAHIDEAVSEKNGTLGPFLPGPARSHRGDSPYPDGASVKPSAFNEFKLKPRI